MVKAVKNDSVGIAVLDNEAQQTEIPQQTMKPKKVRISAEISGEIAERIKNAVYWTPGMTMAGFIEEALAKSIEQLEEEKGEKFPQRERNLVGGRPMT